MGSGDSAVIFPSDPGSLIGDQIRISLSQSLYHVALSGQAEPDLWVTMGTKDQDWTK